MKWRKIAIAACLVGGWTLPALSASAGAGPEPFAGSVSAPATIDGLRFALQEVSARFSLRAGHRRTITDGESWQATCSLDVNGLVMTPAIGTAEAACGPLCIPLPAVVTELTDGTGADLLKGTNQNGEGSVPPRREAVQLLRGLWGNGAGGQTHYWHTSVRGLKRLPREVRSLRGHAAVLVPEQVTRTAVAPEFMADFAEVAPGVRFVLSKYEVGPHNVVLEYEARVSTLSDDQPGAGLPDPMFLGLAARSKEGEMMNLIQPTQELEARDEVVAVAREVRLSREMIERLEAFEVVVVHGLKTVRYDFSVTDLSVSGAD